MNVLALAWASENVGQVRPVPGPLKNGRGAVIPAENVHVRFVRYVASDHALAALDSGCEESRASQVCLLPDLLDSLPRMDLEARTTRPLWLSIDVPPDAEPGLYSGQLKVACPGGGAPPLRLKLEVQAPVLPDPSRWRFRLDLWQNPWAVAHHHGLEPWSRPHLEVLRPHLRMLASAGAKFVTTYVCHSPWKDDTYVADSTMVEWIQEPDGTWSFDYSILDRYVELAGECGLADAITCYTMVPWKNRVRYLDRATGDYSWREWPPQSEEFKAFWRVFLSDLRRHLVQRGWFGRCYMGINENDLQDSLASIRTLKEDSPDWKVTYAGRWHPELDDSLDDYCMIIDESLSPERLRRRRQDDDPLRLLSSPPAQQLRVLAFRRERLDGLVCRGLRLRRLPALGVRQLDRRPGARRSPRPLAGRGLLPGLPGRPKRHPVRAAAGGYRRLREGRDPPREAGRTAGWASLRRRGRDARGPPRIRLSPGPDGSRRRVRPGGPRAPERPHAPPLPARLTASARAGSGWENRGVPGARRSEAGRITGEDR